MKKSALILALLTMPLLIYGQKKPSFGIKAGMNLSALSGNLENEWEVSTEGKIGFHAGILFEIPLSDKFSVQPELLYSVEGVKYKDEGIDGKFSYNFINLPVMAKFYVIENLALEAGPQLSYLLKGKNEESFDVGWDSGEYEADFTKQSNRINFGLNFGASYDIGGKFIIGARYNLGLTNLATDKKATITYSYDGEESETDDSFWGKGYTIKSNVFQLSVGYKF